MVPRALRAVGRYSLGLILIILPGRAYCQSAAALPSAPSTAAQTQPNPPEDQKEKQQHSPTATTGSPGHIFWVVPAFKVDYQHSFRPLTTKEKFQEWAQGAYDPLGLGTGAFEAATLEHSSSDGFCGYGPGWGGYGKCFGSLELDADLSSFIGDFALTSLLHQDPRYFRLGQGSFGRRLWYSVSRVFVTTTTQATRFSTAPRFLEPPSPLAFQTSTTPSRTGEWVIPCHGWHLIWATPRSTTLRPNSGPIFIASCVAYSERAFFSLNSIPPR